MGIMDLFTMEGKITTNANEANSDIDKVTGKARDAEGKMSGSFKKVGQALVAAFAVDKVIGFARQMVETTASIQALDSQFTQTFKDNGAATMELITKQAKDQNINVDRLKGTWSSFYGTFRGGGADANQSLDLTKKYMSLAADGAAYYDTSLEDVVGRLKSITLGNFEAGDAIGLNLNVTKLDTIAKQKYGKAWQELTDTEKEYLLVDTAGKIYENTGAMGQAQREANNYSNVMANLKATWERFISIVGAPVLNGVIFAIQGITGVISQLQTKLQSFNPGEFVTALKAEFPGLETTFVALQIIFFTVRDSFIQIVTAVIATAKQWYTENKATIDQIIETFNVCLGYVKQIISDGTTVIMWIWNSFGKYIFDMAVMYLGFVLMQVQAVLQMVSGVFKIFASLIKGDWSGAWEGVKTLLSGALTYIYVLIVEKLIGAVLGKIKGFGTSLKEGITKPFSDAHSTISGWITKIKDAVANMFSTHIKKPKFTFTGSLNPATWITQGLPELGIKWMSEGGIFTKRTLLGNGFGVGDANKGMGDNAEAVLPLDRLPDILRKAGLGGLTIIIEQFINNRDQDVKSFAEELEQYRKQVSISTGGA